MYNILVCFYYYYRSRECGWRSNEEPGKTHEKAMAIVRPNDPFIITAHLIQIYYLEKVLIFNKSKTSTIFLKILHIIIMRIIGSVFLFNFIRSNSGRPITCLLRIVGRVVEFFLPRIQLSKRS